MGGVMKTYLKTLEILKLASQLTKKGSLADIKRTITSEVSRREY
jgi:hypothetical protein